MPSISSGHVENLAYFTFINPHPFPNHSDLAQQYQGLLRRTDLDSSTTVLPALDNFSTTFLAITLVSSTTDCGINSFFRDTRYTRIFSYFFVDDLNLGLS